MKLASSICMIAALCSIPAFYICGHAQKTQAVDQSGSIAYNAVSPGAHTINNPAVRAEINIKAVRRFKRHYRVDDERWYKLPDCFTAVFKTDGNTSNAYYETNGSWICTLTFFIKKDSLPSVAKLARDSYKDYKVLGVTEVESNGALCYFVYIKNNKATKTLKIQNDEIEVYKELTTTQ